MFSSLTSFVVLPLLLTLSTLSLLFYICLQRLGFGYTLVFPYLHLDSIQQNFFFFLTDKILAKLVGWKWKALSFAGRLTFLRYVVCFMPLFAVHVCYSYSCYRSQFYRISVVQSFFMGPLFPATGVSSYCLGYYLYTSGYGRWIRLALF